jgi:hypothetical protein
MKQDTYPRFLKSDVYKQAVIAEMEGKPFPSSEVTAAKLTANRKVRFNGLLCWSFYFQTCKQCCWLCLYDMYENNNVKF